MNENTKSGYWILVMEEMPYYSCSRCETNVQYRSTFCPHCGTVMMDGIEDNRPLSFSDLLNSDGEPVWGVFGSGEDESWWCLVEVSDVGVVWLTNNLGGRSAFGSDSDLTQANIALYRYRKLGE